MTSLRMPEAHARLIHAHVRRAYPEEACGVLLGRDDGAVRIVTRVLPCENRGASSHANRYLIAPEDVLAADREARAAGLDVVGFFHSHPDHAASPSAFDLEHAWPYYSYLIVSVEQARVGSATSWRLAADRSRFEPEELEEISSGEPA
jgi:proteasome lid subunit RPN8/RPN11